MPNFLLEIISQKIYETWLDRKASTHIRRDRKRGNCVSSREDYKREIHRVICESRGLDAYTGEKLHWNLIKTYHNNEAKKSGKQYKKKFAKLPTIDHVGDGKGRPIFKICSWEVNDAKSDLSLNEFLDLCERVIGYCKK